MAALVQSYINLGARSSRRPAQHSEHSSNCLCTRCQTPPAPRRARSSLADLPLELLRLIYKEVLGHDPRIFFSVSQTRQIYILPHALTQVSRSIRSSFYDYAKLYADIALVFTIIDFDFQPWIAVFEEMPDKILRKLESTVSRHDSLNPQLSRLESLTVKLHFTACSRHRLQHNLYNWLDRVADAEAKGNRVRREWYSVVSFDKGAPTPEELEYMVGSWFQAKRRSWRSDAGHVAQRAELARVHRVIQLYEQGLRAGMKRRTWSVVAGWVGLVVRFGRRAFQAG